MTSVVFSTPGLIPIEAFTTFGVNAKPNSNNPIGFFGTGLKYAIAVCCRMGQQVVIWRGRDKYVFYLSKKDFRGKEFTYVRMKKYTWNPLYSLLRAPSYENLPFTTELGKTWELWQAFREFETNTRDEGGSTFLSQPEELTGLRALQNGDCTQIVVTGQKFVDEFHDMGRNFLVDGASVRTSDERVQVLDRSNKHIYYRGMRVMDLKEEASYTYNFLMHVDLTEDRTAKYPVILEGEIIDYIKKSGDKKMLARVVPTSSYTGPARYEHRLPYATSYFSSASPSPSFLSHAKKAKDVSVRKIWDDNQPTVKTRTRLGVDIPVAGLEDHELAALSELLWSFKQGALLTDESMSTWKNGKRVVEERDKDDVPF